MRSPSLHRAPLWRRLARVASISAGLGAAAVWVPSLWWNAGVGLGAPGMSVAMGMGSANAEVSLVRGGLLLIINGTRADSVTYDPDENFTCTATEAGFHGRLYILSVHTVAGPMVWWPRLERPGASREPYLFVPLWLVMLACFYIAWRAIPRRRKGACPSCGYPLAGLPPSSPCPECGSTSRPAQTRRSRVARNGGNSQRAFAAKLASRVGSIALLGTLSLVALCYSSSFVLHVSRDEPVVMLMSSRLLFSGPESPDPHVYDPGRYSVRAALPWTPLNQQFVPTGWFGYCSNGYLPFARSGWCSTGVCLVKMDSDDPLQPPRVAARYRENPFGGFPAWSRARSPATPGDDAYPYVAEYSFGWPERALMYEVRYDPARKATQVRGAISISYLDRQVGRGNRIDQTIYPALPIFRGFLVDVLVLGVLADRLVAWFLWPPGRLLYRRAMRRRRRNRFSKGVCPICRYQLSGGSGTSCPECGSGFEEYAKTPGQQTASKANLP